MGGRPNLPKRFLVATWLEPETVPSAPAANTKKKVNKKEEKEKKSKEKPSSNKSNAGKRQSTNKRAAESKRTGKKRAAPSEQESIETGKTEKRTDRKGKKIRSSKKPPSKNE
ncbi:sperm-specific protein PHI-2B/PHI-3-like [Centruroides vittatus]|uniref:sperm-specific protein PHI-2B/PHI-3-like n=1 Tax=Centruroides vittatus TaxID=120091 RepID=UPI00351064E1